MRPLTCSAALCLVVVLLPCRYTVRDVAFVDLGGDGWTLRAQVPAGTSADWGATLKRIAMASLADTNVEVVVAPGESGTELGVELVSPDGRTMPVELPGDVDALKRHGWDELDGLASSPVRDHFKSRCLEAHAVVLLFEGRAVADNSRAARLVKEAITQSGSVLAGLPKPAAAPPELHVIPFSERTRERVLHWAVGADEEPADDAHVVVLYGRGRRMGPVLAGPVITASAIKQAIVLIGQDCECELPRSIMRGGQIPLTWDEEQAGAAQKVLGFDGRNPMVKQEIARIVAREATAPNAPRAVGVDPLGLGYHEETVEDPAIDDAGGEAASPDEGEAPSPNEVAGVVVSWMVLAVVALLLIVGIGVAVVMTSARRHG